MTKGNCKLKIANGKLPIGIALALFLVVGHASAAEITSNGKGGGDWSSPSTWLGKKVPEADDDAVIQKGDIVQFDRNDDGKVTCRKLFIDPRGAFRLKTGLGKVTCCLNGPVEARGLIQLDGSKAATDTLELRMVNPNYTLRKIELMKGAGLVLRGRADLEERRNVALTSPKVGDQKENLECAVWAVKGGVAIDLQYADILNIVVRADELDNTGARANERLNVVGCRFTGRGRLWFNKDDTPIVHKNSFMCVEEKPPQTGAILVSECPLANVRDNTVSGWGYGVQGAHLQSATIAGNTVEKASAAYHLGFGRDNSVYKNVAKNCERAFDFHYTQMATLEDNRADGCKIAVRSLCSQAQVASLEMTNVPKDGLGLLYDADAERCEGSVVLINCNITAAQVKLAKPPKLPADAPLPVVAMNCIVVSVPDAPPDAVVDVRTINPAPAVPAGAADPNARNVPAALTKGLTPVPRPAGTPRDALPIFVKAWSIDAAGKTVPAPEYEVRVQTRDGRVVKAVKVKPQDSWYRAKPDDPTPSVEVSLK
jgi:hypothetical protein